MNKSELTYQVKKVLEHYPETRNSDITLTVQIWKEYYSHKLVFNPSGDVLVPVANLFDLPREDNVKRIRATIQNVDREFLPTNINIFIERARQSDEWRKFLGYRVNKAPEVLTDVDIRKAIEDYLSKPAQTALF